LGHFLPHGAGQARGARWTEAAARSSQLYGDEPVNCGRHEHKGRAVAPFCSNGGDSPESAGGSGAFDADSCGMEVALRGTRTVAAVER
jgi:hypothetical protein